MEDNDGHFHHQTKPHAIIFPLSYQGHVTPTINLAMKLASKGFKITFVNTQTIHQQITNGNSDHDIFTGARESGLDVHYKVISDGFLLTFDRLRNHDKFLEGNFHVLPVHVDELVGTLVKEDLSLSCLIADTFHPWTSEISKKYNLVSVSFWTQQALVFTLDYHLDLLKSNIHYDSPNGNREDTIYYIPGVKAIEPKDLMPYLRQTNVSTNSPISRLFHTSFDDVKNVDFILCNTTDDLEPDVIRALTQKQPFYAIGPIISPSTLVIPTSLRSESDCSQWLNTKPKGSVLYVSFGSLMPSIEVDIKNLAKGLLLSDVNFIWILRPNSISYDKPYTPPIEFLNRIEGKGLVLPWCNQEGVVSHPSIGGFLTHCGWNSILDGMRFGVPMLCFPFAFDQIMNRKLVVEDWRVGVDLCDEGAALTEERVAENINRLMSGQWGKELRVEAEKMKDKLGHALAVDGSSEESLCRFVSDVKAKIRDRVREI